MQRLYNLCIIQPDGYEHSNAFVELAELIALGLYDLGYDSMVSRNHIEAHATNIVLGCHLLPIDRAADLPSSTIILNTEQLGGAFPHWELLIRRWAARFETWDYSAVNAVSLRRQSSMPIKLLRIGYHPRLTRITTIADQDIDVLFYGTLSKRRCAVLNSLETAGLRVFKVFGVYGSERDQLIARAKVVLNMHNHETQIFEIVRTFYLMTNRKAVVSELNVNTVIDPVYRGGVFGAPFSKLVDACRELVLDEVLRKHREEKALETIATMPQAKLLEPLLER